MKLYESIGIGVPEVLLPREGVDLHRWAAIACDQYTSQPEYWAEAATLVGDAPSTLKMIFPEVFLSESDPDARIAAIGAEMQRYLDEGVLEPRDGFVYVRRRVGDTVRHGLLVCIDLEAYDYNQGSSSLVRATEGTILSRLPPRVKVREGAPVELPHIMVLIDDPEDSVIGAVAARQPELQKLYDFELMLGGGALEGYGVDAAGEASVVAALGALADPEAFARRYDVEASARPLLFAMGDGNHSLATAKAIWEKAKKESNPAPDDPRRHALVELVNLHDAAMVFEPIHRVVFDVAEGVDIAAELRAHFGDRAKSETVADVDAMIAAVEASTAEVQRFGFLTESTLEVIEVRDADSNLPVGSLKGFLDPFMEAQKAHEVDYVHGTAALTDLGRKPRNAGFFLPGMDKNDLFKTVIVDGALPRKTFSMGEADEKRFYMECRRIK